MKLLFSLLIFLSLPLLAYEPQFVIGDSTIDQNFKNVAAEINNIQTQSINSSGDITLHNSSVIFSTTSGNHGITFQDGTSMTSAGVGQIGVSANTNQFNGNGTLASELTLESSSVTLQGNAVNGNSTLVKTNVSGLVPLSITGNAATVTTNANLTGNVTSVGNTTTIVSVPTGAVNLSTVTTAINGAISPINAALSTSAFLNSTQTFTAGNTFTVSSHTQLCLNSGCIIEWETISGGQSFYISTQATDLTGYYAAYSSYPYTTVYTQTINPISTTMGFSTWTTLSGYPSVSILPNGLWNGEIYAKVSQVTGAEKIRLFFSAYRRSSGGTLSLINTSHLSSELTTSVQSYSLAFSTMSVNLVSGDRLVFVMWYLKSGTGTTPTLSFYSGITYDSHFSIPSQAASIANFVPYAGATRSLDMGAYNVTATNFYGNGSNLTNIPGDNFGSHIATQTINANGNSIAYAKELQLKNTAILAQPISTISFNSGTKDSFDSYVSNIDYAKIVGGVGDSLISQTKGNLKFYTTNNLTDTLQLHMKQGLNGFGKEPSYPVDVDGGMNISGSYMISGSSLPTKATDNTWTGINTFTDRKLIAQTRVFYSTSNIVDSQYAITQNANTSVTQNNSGSASWNNVSNLYAADGNNAYVRGSSGDFFDVNANTFGFSIPTNAVIEGVKVTFKKSEDASADTQDYYCRLVVAGSPSGTDKCPGGEYWTGYTYLGGTVSLGSDSDTWGNALTPAIVNASNFGFYNLITINSVSGLKNAYIDYYAITVYYSVNKYWETGFTDSNPTDFRIKYTSTTVVNISSNNVVGINNSTPNKTYALDVTGKGNFTGGVYKNGIEITGGSGGGDDFGSHIATKTITANYGISASTLTVTGNAFSVGGSTLVVANGRVGVGMTPASPLSISNFNNGIYTANSNSTFNPIFLMKSTSNFVGANALMEMYTSGALSDSHFGVVQVAGGKQDFVFNAYDSAYGEKMRITATGKVGINTTTPGSTLHVVGDGHFSGPVTVASSATMTYASGAQAMFKGYSLVGGAQSYNGSILLGDTAGYQGQIDFNAAGVPGRLTLKSTHGSGLISLVGGGGIDLTGHLTAPNGLTASSVTATGAGSFNNKLVLAPDGATMEILGINNAQTDYNNLSIRSANGTQLFLNTNGNVGIGTTGPGYKLDVQGGDINTSGAYKINGVSVSGLGNVVLASTQTFTGANTFTSSATFTSYISGLSNSSSTKITSSYGFSNNTYVGNTCVTGSTLTINVNAGSRVMVGFSGIVQTDLAGDAALLSFKSGPASSTLVSYDGNRGLSISHDSAANYTHTTSFTAITGVIASAGAYSVCLDARRTGSSITGTILYSANNTNQFWIQELR